jgi:hypothetical protein
MAHLIAMSTLLLAAIYSPRGKACVTPARQMVQLSGMHEQKDKIKYAFILHGWETIYFQYFNSSGYFYELQPCASSKTTVDHMCSKISVATHGYLQSMPQFKV